MISSKLLHFISLHSFPVLFISIIVGVILFIIAVFKKKRIALLFILFPPLGIVSFIWGSDWNDHYVDENGVKGTAVVTQIAPTGVTVNDVQEVKYTTLIKTATGTVESAFYNNGHTFYPKMDVFTPPSIGQVFTVKYIPDDESNFIICTADSNSAFSNQLDCTEVLTRLAAAQAKYRLDSSNAAFRQGYAKALRDLLNAPCDTGLNVIYREKLRELGDN